ncbi:type II toxin-antitoxin system Phd/YefM family antitoxin [Microbispora rosea]|uniref:type II toxin-antitoxin system Phd/YefM family antitoxin n=1 Tax=Microbispora rosea TaxID=58117 RepID=UPI00342F1D68
MTAWQVQEAKQRFSEVVRRALDEGSQVVTRHGEEVAVVIDIAEYRRLKGDAPDFARFLLADPDGDDDVEFLRNKDLPREVDLG